jgi:hypothetical protein
MPDLEEVTIFNCHYDRSKGTAKSSSVIAKWAFSLGITSPTEPPRADGRTLMMDSFGLDNIRVPSRKKEMDDTNKAHSLRNTTDVATLESNSSIFATWILAMACSSAILFLLAGLNRVTAFSIFFVAAAGLASTKFCRPKSRVSYGCMGLLHFSLLFGTFLSKGCAKVAGIELDEKAVKFLFVPASETKAVFGDAFGDAAAGFVFKTLAQAIILTVILAGFATMMAQKTTITKRCLTTVLQLGCLLGIGTLSFVALSQLFVWKGQCSDAKFVGPPPTFMEKKPSMLFISIDSLRQDMFDDSTFPKTRKELMFAGGADHGCTQWPNHDSGGFQSEQGFTSLYYSMRGPTYRHYAPYKRNKDIQSWPLATLKDQGYFLHRITPYNFKYCWVMLEECDLQTRDFHTCDPSINESVSGGDDRVIKSAESWIREQTHRNSSSPFLLTLDFQDVRFPYKVKQNPAPDIQYYEPSLTDTEVYTLKQDVTKMDTASLDAIRPKLINRVKNSMLGLDNMLADFLRNIRPYSSNMIIVFTSDHGELFMDGSDKKNFGHALEDSSDLQRRVPLVMCGPTKVVSELQVPENVVTSHTDVFPSLLEACGATLGDEWKRELDYRSYYRYQQKGEDSGLAFAHHPWSDLVIIKTGSKRLVTRGSRVLKFENLDDTDGTDQEAAIKALRDMVPHGKDRHWPGMQPGCDASEDFTITGREDLEEGNDDLTIAMDDPAFVGSWFQTAHSLEANFAVAIGANIEPWLTSTRDLNPADVPFTIDVLSIGSMNRPDYLHAQESTWASHGSVRTFWGLTEHNDFNPTCGNMSRAEVEEHMARCNKFKGWKKSMKHFIGDGYSIAEEQVRRDAGWVCAQRRVGRALFWLKKLYAMRKDDLPDYLLLVDDDTYFDVVSFEEYVVRKKLDPSKTEMHGACLFQRSGYIKWSFPYGGFGTVFTRASIERMLRPIHCQNATAGDDFIQGCCQSLKKNRIGERAVFQEGMSVLDLFHVYSALRMFCIHSDWLTGYIANFYGLSERDADTEGDEDREMRMYGMAVWPDQCGNMTMVCVDGSDVCHRQGPKAMQHFAMISYSKHTDHYRRAPELRRKAEHTLVTMT